MESQTATSSLASILAEGTQEEKELLARQAKACLWEAGDLTFLMHPGQKEAWEAIQASGVSRFVLEIARKWGKTWFLVVVAAMECLKRPGSRVVYGAPSLKHLTEFVLPVMDEITRDCPESVRPEFSAYSGHWTFPNGSWVHLFGADDKRKADRGRGPKAEMAIFDECGFSPVLNYVLTSIFRPSLLHGGGMTLLASTPAEEPDHDFTRICEVAESNGSWMRKTIFDNPLLTQEQIKRFIEEDARDNGYSVDEYLKTSEFRREYMAERVTDKTLSVLGDDWELAKANAIVELQRPQFFDAYVALDFGGIDPHAALFGYWDFKNGWLVIEDELLLREGENTSQLAEAIKEKEKALWGTSGWDGTLRAAKDFQSLPEWLKTGIEVEGQPYLRVCDTDVALARDLAQLHGIGFIPTAKDEKLLQVNELRILLRQGRVKIHPRCKHLDRHLRQTMWASHRQTDYKRKNGEHGDLLDAIVYMVRNLRKSKNPWPENFGVNKDDVWVRPTQSSSLKKLIRR
jgi:hypothetical protein